jgi:hypothetical protein
VTFATLKSDIAAYAHHTGLTAVIPTFVRQAEAEIRNDVRVRAMETAATIAIVSGSASVPSGFIEAQRLILDNSTAWALDYLPPSLFYSSDNYRASGPTVAWTLEGDTIKFRPVVDQSALLGFVKAFDALAADGDTNWLLTNSYNVYLYGSLIFAADYLKDFDSMAKWQAMYAKAVGSLNKTSERSRYAGAPLTISGNVGP